MSRYEYNVYDMPAVVPALQEWAPEIEREHERERNDAVVITIRDVGRKVHRPHGERPREDN